MSVSYGKKAKAKATKLHSILVRSHGECENCFYKCPCGERFKHTLGCKLQCAHIQGRTASATRTLLINAFCLCASCHRIFTDKPLSFSRFVTGTWAQEYRDLLLSLSNTMTKKDWVVELERLEHIKQELEAGRTLAELRQEEAENL